MAEQEVQVIRMSSQGHTKSNKDNESCSKNKRKKQFLEGEKVGEVNGGNSVEEGNLLLTDMKAESGKKKRKRKILKNTALSEGGGLTERTRKEKRKIKIQMSGETSKGEEEEEEYNKLASHEDVNPRAESEEREEEKHSLKLSAKAEEEKMGNGINPLEEMDPESGDERADSLKNDKKKKKKKLKKLLREAEKADKRGICYLSRIPPKMDHVQLRQILSQYGEIQRIYLAPEDPTAQVRQKKPGKFQVKGFSEGWVEFANKSVAKRVANLLNGEQIGGRKRSQFHFDLWNIKYLSKFKWDDLTGETAYKNAVNKQKLALAFSAAKRERDMYLDKVDQSRALSSIEERMKKKQKVQQESDAQPSISKQAPKIIRQFPQTKPVADKTEKSKPLTKEFLSGVFCSS